MAAFLLARSKESQQMMQAGLLCALITRGSDNFWHGQILILVWWCREIDPPRHRNTS